MDKKLLITLLVIGALGFGYAFYVLYYVPMECAVFICLGGEASSIIVSIVTAFILLLILIVTSIGKALRKRREQGQMNKVKNNLPIILVGIIVILIGVVGYFIFVKKSKPTTQIPTSSNTQEFTSEGIPKEGLLKAQMVPLITDVQMLSLDLKNYYKLRKNYPLSLEAFISDNSYSERSVFISKDKISKYWYVVSSDHQHFVIYAALSLSKNKIGLVNGKPINTVVGNVLGVACSDPKIFCSTD